jgi:hypothetical protein
MFFMTILPSFGASCVLGEVSAKSELAADFQRIEHL